MAKEKSSAAVRSDLVGNRLALAVLLAFAGMASLMFLYNALIGISSVLSATFFVKVLCAVSGALFAGALAFFIVRRAKKADDRGRLINSVNLLCLAAGLFAASGFLVLRGASAARVLMIAVPVVTAYYLIYYIYQREFFVLSLGAGALLLGVFFFRRYMSYVSLQKAMPVLLIAAAAVLAAQTAALVVGMTRGKAVRLFGKTFQPTKAFFLGGLVLTGAALLIVLGALLFGSLVPYYGFYVMAGLLALTAIYYTVKLA